MGRLQLEVRVGRSPELAARGIEQATHALTAGDRAAAERSYHDAQGAGLLHPASWSNLAALGIALDDATGARTHARHALRLDRANADAWVNLGVASWNAGQRRDAAQAMHHALQLAPGLETAALNYAQMLQAVDRPAQVREMLEQAVSANPQAWRLRQAAAETARQTGDAEAVRRHALAALAILRPQLHPAAETSPAPAAPHEDADAAASARVQQTLFAARDALAAAGVPFYLMAGTLLAIHRDGRPFPHDKDIDLALPFDADRDAVAAAFAEGFRPLARPGHAGVADSREWVMGFIHEASGIGVDLMFARERDGVIRFELGWPDRLASEIPAYPLETLSWAGCEWSTPSPPSQYLDAIYGPDWNGGAVIRGFERRYFDTQVSNPSRTADSLPRAVNLVLLRLLHALQAGQWAKARALCIQILAREPLAEVAAVLARLDIGDTG